jgi:multiple antibiotic resistance protein
MVLSDFYSALVLLFLVMDPLGNLPIFLSVLETVPEQRRLRIVLREMVLALVVMMLFLFGGQWVLQALHLSEESVYISGGIILFLIALKMVFPVAKAAQAEDDIDGEPLLVPLAIPLVAGPSSLAVLMLLAAREPGQMPIWVMALLCAWLISVVILLAATQLQHFLGRRGLIAMERLMGLVLVAIAVQMFLDGIENYLSHI